MRSAPWQLDAVNGRHELVVRVERHLSQARVRRRGLRHVHAQLLREHHKGSLRGVADDHAVGAHRGVVRERKRERELATVCTGSPSALRTSPSNE